MHVGGNIYRTLMRPLFPDEQKLDFQGLCMQSGGIMWNPHPGPLPRCGIRATRVAVPCPCCVAMRPLPPTCKHAKPPACTMFEAPLKQVVIMRFQSVCTGCPSCSQQQLSQCNHILRPQNIDCIPRRGQPPARSPWTCLSGSQAMWRRLSPLQAARFG